MELQSNNKLQLVTRERKTHLICFDEVQKEIDLETGDKQLTFFYEATRIIYPYTKEQLITSIIREHYSQDNMEAIINNHISGEETQEQKEDFNKMQLWRIKAKEIANQVFNN